MMTYEDATEWLFTQTAVFSREGASAYKPGLDTIRNLCARLGNPQEKLKCIHVGGTNGKGSTASTLAAIFQSAGYRTALYTSPHLVDFRERMRVNGEIIPRERVVEFVESYRQNPMIPQPSFFELTTAMAFQWFAEQAAEIAIIEVGLGGRLDSTNIITPLVSVITNISLDHTSLLGETVAEIATEKAGIIKPGVPVVIGEADDADVKRVFEQTAEQQGSNISFANTLPPDFELSLQGEFQRKNAATVLAVMEHFPEIAADAIRAGFANVETLTGLRGRLSVWQETPQRIVYDTGHNPGAWQYLSSQLQDVDTMVIGFAADKDVDTIMHLLPRSPRYIFTRPSGLRGLDAEKLREKAADAGIAGEAIASVAEAVEHARAVTRQGGTIFIGGSNFVVADFLNSHILVKFAG